MQQGHDTTILPHDSPADALAGKRWKDANYLELPREPCVVVVVCGQRPAINLATSVTERGRLLTHEVHV